MLLFALLLQSTQPAKPPMPPVPPLHGGPQERTCPVGGERFSAWEASMYSTYGERPDGKPYSYLPFPFPLPECPSNRLIVFSDFTADEVAVLTRLIATPDYARLIGTETTYYRAYWLSTQLGRPAVQSLNWLLPAIWQLTPGAQLPQSAQQAAQSRRYRQLFVNEVQKLGDAVPPKDRMWLEARAANAAREMGAFDTANALRTKAAQSLAGLPDKRGWDRYLSSLEAVIARRDTSIEPLDMIPKREIPSACRSAPPTNAFDRAICDRPEVRARIAELATSQP